VKQIVSLAVLVVVFGVGFLLISDGDGDGDSSEGSNGGKPNALAFYGVELEDFKLIVPADWIKDDESLTTLVKDGVAVRGEKEDGFHPAILFYPVLARKRSFEQFIGDERSKLTDSGDPAEILADGPAVVGGMAAHRLVYTRTVRGGIQVRTIDFYFVGPKGIGMLRMLSNSTTFMKWRPVFERVASALRRK